MPGEHITPSRFLFDPEGNSKDAERVGRVARRAQRGTSLADREAAAQRAVDSAEEMAAQREEMEAKRAEKQQAQAGAPRPARSGRNSPGGEPMTQDAERKLQEALELKARAKPRQAAAFEADEPEDVSGEEPDEVFGELLEDAEPDDDDEPEEIDGEYEDGGELEDLSDGGGVTVDLAADGDGKVDWSLRPTENMIDLLRHQWGLPEYKDLTLYERMDKIADEWHIDRALVYATVREVIARPHQVSLERMLATDSASADLPPVLHGDDDFSSESYTGKVDEDGDDEASIEYSRLPFAPIGEQTQTFVMGDRLRIRHPLTGEALTVAITAISWDDTEGLDVRWQHVDGDDD